MLCSECNKNNAEIFINKIENGVSSMEGLCRECAKKKGIDPKAKNKKGKQSKFSSKYSERIKSIKDS